jgi:hypothetical protein
VIQRRITPFSSSVSPPSFIGSLASENGLPKGLRSARFGPACLRQVERCLPVFSCRVHLFLPLSCRTVTGGTEATVRSNSDKSEQFGSARSVYARFVLVCDRHCAAIPMHPATVPFASTGKFFKCWEIDCERYYSPSQGYFFLRSERVQKGTRAMMECPSPDCTKSVSGDHSERGGT